MSVGRLLPTKQYRNGWLAWKKIAQHFGSEKFVIRESRLNGNEVVIIANLDAIERVYQQNCSLFDKAFEGRMSLNALKECISTENSLFQELLKNDACFGLLLGYGAENARLFASGAEKLAPFSNKHPIFYCFSSVMPVYFACDLKSEETKELRTRYQADRAAILKKENLFLSMLVALHNSR